MIRVCDSIEDKLRLLLASCLISAMGGPVLHTFPFYVQNPVNGACCLKFALKVSGSDELSKIVRPCRSRFIGRWVEIELTRLFADTGFQRALYDIPTHVIGTRVELSGQQGPGVPKVKLRQFLEIAFVQPSVVAAETITSRRAVSRPILSRPIP